jgi:hypothetical protein
LQYKDQEMNVARAQASPASSEVTTSADD